MQDPWERSELFLKDTEVDYYTFIGVSRTATAAEIEQSYRQLVRNAHTDHMDGDADPEDIASE